MNTESWIIDEFSDAPLADNRLVKRLINIADCFYSLPGASVSTACGDYPAALAAYRFFSNSRVKPEAILMGHREQTIERMKAYDTALIIQDKTTLDYTDHPATKGIGLCTTTKNSLGLLNHTALAVTTDGVPLGVLARSVWTRDPEQHGKRLTRKIREISDKESRVWLDTLDVSSAGIPSYINTVTVCDREADIYDFFRKAVDDRHNLLVRVAQDRRVMEEGKLLKSEIENKSVAGQITVSVPRDTKNNRPAREAVLAIRYCPVTVRPPKYRSEGSSQVLPCLKLHLISAQEVNPPEGIKPINWLLVTTMTVETLEQALEKIHWYKQRWKIERYHLILKSGCKVEDLQLETVESLQNALAVYSVIAWKLLWLKQESEQQPEELCDKILTESEWQALYCVTHRTPKPPLQPPTLKDAVLMIAKLGGFLGRKSDGKPGIIVIWRGLRRLQDIVEGWMVAHLPVNSQ